MIAWIGLTIACFVVVAWVFIFIEDHPGGFVTLLAVILGLGYLFVVGPHFPPPYVRWSPPAWW